MYYSALPGSSKPRARQGGPRIAMGDFICATANSSDFRHLAMNVSEILRTTIVDSELFEVDASHRNGERPAGNGGDARLYFLPGAYGNDSRYVLTGVVHEIKESAAAGGRLVNIALEVKVVETLTGLTVFDRVYRCRNVFRCSPGSSVFRHTASGMAVALTAEHFLLDIEDIVGRIERISA